MNARIIPFPPRGPFVVSIYREGRAWRVVCRSHGRLCGSHSSAMATAEEIARGHGVHVVEARR